LKSKQNTVHKIFAGIQSEQLFLAGIKENLSVDPGESLNNVGAFSLDFQLDDLASQKKP
jgi:hypothetical protein